ncbi:uncharacterized protein VTP21DRAFT_7621 [Calcarisporiella thermophila]|uniref:uncharacterized protein n=1 Tax=Calcarisporiella thermophila TaxID=911321 RepID=UPI0037432334
MNTPYPFGPHLMSEVAPSGPWSGVMASSLVLLILVAQRGGPLQFWLYEYAVPPSHYDKSNHKALLDEHDDVAAARRLAKHRCFLPHANTLAAAALPPLRFHQTLHPSSGLPEHALGPPSLPINLKANFKTANAVKALKPPSPALLFRQTFSAPLPCPRSSSNQTQCSLHIPFWPSPTQAGRAYPVASRNNVQSLKLAFFTLRTGAFPPKRNGPALQSFFFFVSKVTQPLNRVA